MNVWALVRMQDANGKDSCGAGVTRSRFQVTKVAGGRSKWSLETS